MLSAGLLNEKVLAKMGWKRRQELIRVALNPSSKKRGGEACCLNENKYRDLEEFDDTHCVYSEDGAWYICPYKIEGKDESEKASIGKPERLQLTRVVAVGKDKREPEESEESKKKDGFRVKPGMTA